MLKIETERFGEIEIDESKLITFTGGLLGLEEYNKFALLNIEESFPIMWLQCVTDGGVALPVVDTFSVEPEYAFTLDEEDVNELEIESPDDVQLVSVLSIQDNVEQMTMNLAAPLVINARTGRAKNVVLSNPDYVVKSPVFEKICRLLKEEEADADSVSEG